MFKVKMGLLVCLLIGFVQTSVFGQDSTAEKLQKFNNMGAELSEMMNAALVAQSSGDNARVCMAFQKIYLKTTEGIKFGEAILLELENKVADSENEKETIRKQIQEIKGSLGSAQRGLSNILNVLQQYNCN